MVIDCADTAVPVGTLLMVASLATSVLPSGFTLMCCTL